MKYIGDGVFWNCGDIDNVNNMNRETVSEYSKYEVTATDHLNLMQIVKRDIYYRDKYGIRIDSNGKLYSEQDKSMGEKFDIPGVVSIGYKGLAGRDFTAITFPETLQTIHMQAFMNCANLKCVEVPGSVEELSSNVFELCTNLEYASLPGTIEYAICTFKDCTSLNKVDLEEGIVKLYGTFINCKKLHEINLPSTITDIRNAFVRSGLCF